MFQRIASRPSLATHVGGGLAAAAHAGTKPTGSAGARALFRPPGEPAPAAPAPSLVQRQPRAGFHGGAGAVVQPAAILKNWHARADRLESEDFHLYANRLRSQRERAAFLLREPQPSLDDDAAVRGLLLGDPPGPAGMLQAQDPAVRRAIEMLAPKPGERFVFVDPPDLRLCALLAAHGCECVVGVSNPKAALQLAEELPRWQNAPPMTGPGPAEHARTTARRIRLVSSTAILAPDRASAPLRAGGAQGVVSLLTLQRQRSRTEAESALHAQAGQLAPGGGLVFDLLHTAGSARQPSDRAPLLLSFKSLQDVMREQGLQLAHVAVSAQPVAEEMAPAPARVLARRAGSDAIDPQAADEAAWNVWQEAPAREAGDAVSLEVRVSGLMRKSR